MHRRFRICRLSVLQNNYFCVFSNCKNRMAELLFFLFFFYTCTHTYTCSHNVRYAVQLQKYKNIGKILLHEAKATKYSSRSLKQWGLIHISVYSTVIGMLWESTEKTLCWRTNAFFLFFLCLLISMPLCVFLVPRLCPLKHNYVMFWDMPRVTSLCRLEKKTDLWCHDLPGAYASRAFSVDIRCKNWWGSGIGLSSCKKRYQKILYHSSPKRSTKNYQL